MCHCVVPNVPTVRQWSAAHACVNRRWENVGRGIVVDDLETLNPRPHEFHLAPLLEKESSCEPVNDDTAFDIVHVGIHRAARNRRRCREFLETLPDGCWLCFMGIVRGHTESPFGVSLEAFVR